MSRTLAAKSSLAVRYDALSEHDVMTQHTIKARAKLEQKLVFMEQSVNKPSATSSRFQPKFSQYTNVSQVYSYNTANDVIIPKKRKGNFDVGEQLSEEAPLNVPDDTLNQSATKKKKKSQKASDI
uniref:Nucleolar protein 58 (Trinotate prediction) n=1 Tax=Myxobolus squamalis TaxID=59785 RepID=A0A6B2G153_MYXSQ